MHNLVGCKSKVDPPRRSKRVPDNCTSLDIVERGMSSKQSCELVAIEKSRCAQEEPSRVLAPSPRLLHPQTHLPWITHVIVTASCVVFTYLAPAESNQDREVHRQRCSNDRCALDFLLSEPLTLTAMVASSLPKLDSIR